ncbi:MAG TPA: DUF4197 domain-containing protein [Phnomibacter sp.]|nr:DUF4197 domain-containing protein [Phnomibacter sp.]
MKTLIRSLIIMMAAFAMNSCASLQKAAGLTELEAILGLKDALNQGMFRSFDAFANPNQEGNAIVRFALPEQAAAIQSTLNSLGLGSALDKATAKFTKAMGDAVVAAKPIFTNSIKKLTIKDAFNILVTDNMHAATDYFKRVNKPLLLDAFRPIVDSTIAAEQADLDWKKVTSVYNLIPLKKEPLEPNLTDFISARVIDGMCLIMANEEENVRSKYSFRKTDMMQKAFGYAEQELKRRMTR